MNTPELVAFIQKASRATYASSGVESTAYDAEGFKTLRFTEGDFEYTDTYTGFYKSRGQEIVRYQGKPVWMASYGGGMTVEDPDLAIQTFGFLKQAFLTEDSSFQSFRGPAHLISGDWSYTYSQEGTVEEFSGYEEIRHKNVLVFFHRIIGGLVQQK